MKCFKHVVYLCEKEHPTFHYHLQPQTPRKCWSRSCTSGLCFLSHSGPRRRLLALLPFSLFSLPNLPQSPSNYYNSTSIFSHDKSLMRNISRLRTSAGMVLPDLVKHCSLISKANSLVEKDPSGFKFKIFEEIKYERKKLVAKGIGVLGLFVYLFVCFWEVED